MWVARKHNGMLLYLELISDNHEHTFLPIFTTPDIAINFIGDIKFDGEFITLINIIEISLLKELIMDIYHREADLILDPPNMEKGGDGQLVCWTREEFAEMLDQIIKMGEQYGDEKAIIVLNNYLRERSRISLIPVRKHS